MLLLNDSSHLPDNYALLEFTDSGFHNYYIKFINFFAIAAIFCHYKMNSFDIFDICDIQD